MPAERQQRSHHRPKHQRTASPAAGASTAGPGGAPSPFKVLPLEQRTPQGLPGVSKLKSQIRQTKRLLSKENLEPALRVATQRRLTALEVDLATAERRGVEKRNGTKYHAVKFFERQKLGRIIRRLQRDLSKVSSESERSALETELANARVMLNYIINYPNAEKYIAIFPADPSREKGKGPASSSDDAAASAAAEQPRTLPPLLAGSLDDGKLDKPGRRRLEMLLETRRLMSAGKLSATPETEARAVDRADRVTIAGEAALSKPKAKEAASKADEADDFFDGDDDDDDDDDDE